MNRVVAIFSGGNRQRVNGRIGVGDVNLAVFLFHNYFFKGTGSLRESHVMTNFSVAG